MVREIKLKNNMVCIVDDEDYYKLINYNWYILFDVSNYYVITGIKINNRWTTKRMHRLILNPQPNEQIDHINGNGLDNRKSNLRIVNNQQNHYNQKKTKTYNRKKCSSIYKGICKQQNGKWRARIKNNEKRLDLGYFDEEIDAARAYDIKARELFGEYSNLNFPV